MLRPHIPELIRAKQNDTNDTDRRGHQIAHAFIGVKRSRKPANKESVSVLLEPKSMFFGGVLYAAKHIQRNEIEYTSESNQLASASRGSMQMCDTTLTCDSTCGDFRVHQQYYAMSRS